MGATTQSPLVCEPCEHGRAILSSRPNSNCLWRNVSIAKACGGEISSTQDHARTAVNPTKSIYSLDLDSRRSVSVPPLGWNSGSGPFRSNSDRPCWLSAAGHSIGAGLEGLHSDLPHEPQVELLGHEAEDHEAELALVRADLEEIGRC